MSSETPEQADAPAARRKPVVLIAVIAVVLLLLLIGGGVGLFVMLNKKSVTTEKVTPNTAHKGEDREVPAVTFTDVTASSGVKFKHESGFTPYKLLPETMGGGVACFDYDGDGKPDILFINSCPWPGADREPKGGNSSGPPTLRLYHNLGNWKFEDVTAAAGLNVTLFGMGVAIGDFDNDGHPDIFVSCVGKHHLFRNVDGKRFEDVTDTAGVGGPGRLPEVTKEGWVQSEKAVPLGSLGGGAVIATTAKEKFADWEDPIPFGSSATFLDYDGDGKLDLFVCHYVTWSPKIDRNVVSHLEGGKRSYVQPKDMDGSQCTLYRNLGGGKFADVSKEAGVLVTSKDRTDITARERPVGKALGVIAWDADGDGWPDLMVANDSVRNFFFHNVPGPDGTRMFKEDGVNLGAGYAEGGVPRGGMGIDWGEFAPGRCSAVVANFANEPITFLEKNNRQLSFSDSAVNVGLVGPTRSPLKFGTLFFDYDNDGRLDLLINNGHIDPEIRTIQPNQNYAQPPQLYWNTGDPECYFAAVPAKAAGEGLFQPLVGRGSAFADFDGDGNLDVVLVANGGEARILRNDGSGKNHSVRLELKGDGVKSNRSALGAMVTVEAGGQTYTRPITGGRGYLSQSELTLTVGIGTATKADKVTVRWPGKDAGSDTWADLKTGETHTLEQGKGQKK